LSDRPADPLPEPAVQRPEDHHEHRREEHRQQKAGHHPEGEQAKKHHQAKEHAEGDQAGHDRREAGVTERRRERVYLATVTQAHQRTR
jgi:hypothetical protein